MKKKSPAISPISVAVVSETQNDDRWLVLNESRHPARGASTIAGWRCFKVHLLPFLGVWDFFRANKKGGPVMFEDDYFFGRYLFLDGLDYLEKYV